MGWTDEQNKVINTSNCNLLVSAAAGSGKTAVLVERIITKITKGSKEVSDHNLYNIDELLVVTFTKAAAAEMKERIGKAIDLKCIEEPENNHLKKQVSLIHTAKITTIDSFCLDVIRNYFHHIDLDPGFRIANEAELALMKSDVLSDVIEKYYDEAEEDFLLFIECYTGSKTDKKLEEYILHLYDYSMSYPWPEQWLLSITDQFNYENVESFYQSMLINELLVHIKNMLEDAYKINEAAISVSNGVRGPYMYGAALQSDKDILENLINADTYDMMYELMNTTLFVTLSRKKDADVDDELREKVKTLRNEVKDILTGIKKSFFYQDSKAMFEDILMTRPSMQVLCQMTIDFIKAFAEVKREKNLIDFHDMEHFALNILVNREGAYDEPSKAAKELRTQYAEIMIDEYQDSNYVQEKILKSISREWSGEPNMFMVGDVKQSIYKFRLAKPELFMEKYEKYTKEEGDCQKIDLFKNFRSRTEILSSVNEVFYNIMRKEFGGIEYDASARLYEGAQFIIDPDKTDTYMSELILVTDNEKDEIHDNLREETIHEKSIETDILEDEEYGKKELEAYAIARRIKELTHPVTGIMITKKIDGKDVLRPAMLKDIAILLRTMTGWSELFLEILSQEGINAYAETKTGYFKSMEIKTMLSLLSVLDNPRQDIPFTAVLYSPFAGLISEELAQIRMLNKKKSIYEAAKLYIENGLDIELKEKLIVFMKLYNTLRSQSLYMTVKELLQEILAVTKYDYYVLAMPFGEQRKRNLDMLIRQAAAYEETSWHGLFQFVRYVDRLIKYDIDYGENQSFSEQDNAVRIMSIHKSKGLEFPIVIAAGMSKRFNMRDARSSMILHEEIGIGPDCIDYKLRTKTPTLLKKIIQQRITAENLYEEIRVLYVAMTRAKEKLIMTGYIEDIEKSIAKWEEAGKYDRCFLNHHLLKASSFMDYLGPCIKNGSMTKIRVINASDIINDKSIEQWKKDKLMDDFEYKLSGHRYNNDISDKLLSEINYIYPFIKEAGLPIKMSVSLLKKQSIEAEPETIYSIESPMVPKFLDNTEDISADKLGTLYHKIMELIEYAEYADAEQKGILPAQFVNQQLELLISKELIIKDELKHVKLEKIYSFFETPISHRMAAAAKRGLLFKEQRFVIKRLAKELISDYEGMEEILVQGIFDAYFEEDGEIVLLDYKTDYVPSQEDNYLRNKYNVQLKSYVKALRQLTGKEIKEVKIYSFYLSSLV